MFINTKIFQIYLSKKSLRRSVTESDLNIIVFFGKKQSNLADYSPKIGWLLSDMVNMIVKFE